MPIHLYDTMTEAEIAERKRQQRIAKRAEMEKFKQGLQGKKLKELNRDLMREWYYNFQQFPRIERYALAEDIKHCLFQYDALVIRGLKKYMKKTTLQDADICLEQLRHFNELSYDLHYINETRFDMTAYVMSECGKQLGGWIKSEDKGTSSKST